MPIYEYECQKCGLFEVTRKITDKPLERCPTCKGKAKKLISNTSFQLKGTGWYVTDYARKGSAEKSEKSPTAEPKTDGKADSGSKAESTSSTEKKPAKAAAKSDAT